MEVFLLFYPLDTETLFQSGGEILEPSACAEIYWISEFKLETLNRFDLAANIGGCGSDVLILTYVGISVMRGRNPGSCGFVPLELTRCSHGMLSTKRLPHPLLIDFEMGSNRTSFLWVTG